MAYVGKPAAGEVLTSSSGLISAFSQTLTSTTSDTFVFETTQAGHTREVIIRNDNEANTASSAKLSITAGLNSGGGSGDPSAVFGIAGVQNFAIGIDNSDSDKFKIAASNALGTSDVITVTTGSIVGIGNNAPSTNAKLELQSTNSYGLYQTGTQTSKDGSSNQYSQFISTTLNPTGGSTRAEGIGVFCSFISPTSQTISTAAGLHISHTASSNVGTISELYGIRVESGSSGAGTITNAYGIRADVPAHGTSKFACIFGNNGVVVDSASRAIIGGFTSADTGCQFQVNQVNGVSSTVICETFANQNSQTYHFIFKNPGQQAGSIATTNNATAFATSSDARLKKNVKGVIGAGQLLDKLNPVTFVWKNNEEPATGFIAQDLVKDVPEAVVPGDTNPNGKVGDNNFQQWFVDASRLVPYLVAEIKSLRTRVALLESKV